jgi:hypothetical protein
VWTTRESREERPRSGYLDVLSAREIQTRALEDRLGALDQDEDDDHDPDEYPEDESAHAASLPDCSCGPRARNRRDRLQLRYVDFGLIAHH